MTRHWAAIHISYGLLPLPPSRLTHLLLRPACQSLLSRTTNNSGLCCLSMATGAPPNNLRGGCYYYSPHVDEESKVQRGQSLLRTPGCWWQEQAKTSTSGCELSVISLAPEALCYSGSRLPPED